MDVWLRCGSRAASAAVRAAYGGSNWEGMLPLAEAAARMGISEAECARLARGGVLAWKVWGDAVFVRPAILRGPVH